MSDALVDRWKQRGNISLWRVKKRPNKGWNFSGDAEGRSALVELLAHMESARFGSRRTLTLVKVETTPDHGGVYTIALRRRSSLVIQEIGFPLTTGY